MTLNVTWYLILICCSLIDQRQVKPNQLGTTLNFALTRVEQRSKSVTVPIYPSHKSINFEATEMCPKPYECLIVESHSLLTRHGLHVQEMYLLLFVLLPAQYE